MKYAAIASVIAFGVAFVDAAPSATLNKRFTVVGAPSGDVTCPDFRDGSESKFTAAYVTNNIDIMLSNGKKKGKYPQPFNDKNPNSGQFEWENNCDRSKVLELPLWKNKAGNEIPWWDNTAWDNNNNKPGIFREYYVLDGDEATWCGAYAHADTNSNGDFKRCSW